MYGEEPISESTYWDMVDAGFNISCDCIRVVIMVIVTIIVFPLYLIGRLK